MSLSFKQKIILSKLEATYGTDAAPTGAANAIQLSNVNITPMEADEVRRDLVGRGRGAQAKALANKKVRMTAEVECAGAGAAGTAPAYGPLLRSCGFAETISAGVDVQYQPASANLESATHYFNIDGNRHALLGSRGTVGFDFQAGQIPKLKFEYIGLWSDPIAEAFPAGDFTAFQDPLIVSLANTPTFTLHGYSAVMHGLEISMNNTLTFRDLVNESSIEIPDRDASGSLTIDAPAIGTKDFFNIASLGTQDALQLVHGTAAGHIIQIDAPKVQIGAPNYGDADSVATLEMGLTVIPDAGDDEITITVK